MTVARPVVRRGRLALGLVLIGASPLASPLPGPGGLMMFAGGLSLTLRNSAKARRMFARQMKLHPRTGALLDRALRRESAKRRRARDGAGRDGAGQDGTDRDGAPRVD